MNRTTRWALGDEECLKILGDEWKSLRHKANAAFTPREGIDAQVDANQNAEYHRLSCLAIDKAREIADTFGGDAYADIVKEYNQELLVKNQTDINTRFIGLDE